MTRRLSGRVRVVLVGVSFTLMLASPLAGRQERAVEPSRPAIAPASPLATDGTWLFAATTGGVLVRRALKGSGEWETVPVSLAIGAITGLAGSRTALYVADGSAAAIYRVGLDGKTSDTLIHKGPPLRAPADLAVAGPDLFVADRGAGMLFRIKVDGADARRDVAPTGVVLDASAYLGGTDEELVVSSPESGAMIRVGLTGGDARKTSVLQRTVDTSALPVTRYEMRTELGPRVVKRDDYPGVARPGPLAVHAGLVYVIDQQTNSLFVASLYDARTVRLPLSSGATFKPARVLATSDDLWILDAGRGDVTRWPRMVPVEIRLERAPSEAMVGLYEYLQRTRLLSTRTITVQDNVANTLKRESVLPAGYVEDFAPVLCGLNRPLCEPDGTIRPLQAGQPIQVPDLYSESYIDVRRVTLDGTRTLGAVVDADIRDPAFARLQTEDHLKAINRWADLPDPSAHVRDQKFGTYEVPFEAVRYLAAVRVADLRSPKSGLSRLLAAYNGVLKLRSLERAPSRQPSSAQPADPPTDLNTVSQAHDRLRQTIGYDVPSAGEGSEYVGIAEEEIDRSHPAFVDEAGGTAIIDVEPPPASAPPMASSPAAPPPAPPAAGAQTLGVRKFDQADHGTAVASLVAARRGFPATGFAPNSFIVPVHKEEPGLSGDIEYAIAHTPARIFNLSVELQGESESLWDLITRHQDKALFVVAAGNNDAEVCRRTRRYPVCWGDEKNVIVVTGTTLDGQGRLPSSNYSPRFVHVAAPARDFYAAGKGRSYVPVEGTSFATPIVTATAALLRAQGVAEPALIKQRIIAATDHLSTMSGQIVGGRLNVRRALRPPRLAALMQNSAEILVELAPGRQNLEFIIRGTSVPLALRSVRRLQNKGTWYRLAYADADDKLHIVSVQVGTWPIRYRLTDQNFRPVGPLVETDLAEFQDYLGPVKW